MKHTTITRQTLTSILGTIALLLASFTHAETEETSYAITGYQMTTVASGANFNPAALTLDVTLPEDKLLTWPFLFLGTDTAAEMTVHFNGNALVAFTHEELIEGYWNYLYIDVEAYAGQTGELQLTLNSQTAPATVLLVEDAREPDGWPGYFSGTAPTAELDLPLNNIGEFNENDGRIYTCLAIMANNQPSHLDGVPEFDIAFEIVSLEQGLIRVADTRPFNPTEALTNAGEAPSCSGQFETTTNLYTDTVSVALQTLRVTFELIDGDTLTLRLKSADEL